ncbi:FecR family protein [Neorhizobium sp. DT-125]|uniref:FecR family protein n=1 Tax=Neorhizobium sp. DT-125 TaxID=3396163 RepID=UPI003F1BA410
MLSEDIEALKREALAWIVRLTSGTATTEDRDAFLRWRARSAAHEQAFRDASRLWKNMGAALAAHSEPSPAFFSRRAVLTGGACLTAGVAGMSFGLSQLGVLPTLDAFLSDVSTAVGEQKTAQLPDGSSVTLDGGTMLNVNYSEQARHVELAAGAAVFQVVEQQRPFVVSAKSGRSTTRRAAISIKHGVEDVLVECLDGSVNVECRGDARLSAGDGIFYSAAGLGEKLALDEETAAAWRKGLLIFRNRPLADVIADVNRHRRGKVMIARRSLNSRRVSGVFHLHRPNEILAHLESTLHVRPINLVGGIVLLQ